MNILLIGSDKSNVPGDPGRSDTQMLMRLDPETKSISMLSLPRDLRVDIEGVGYDKMNAAYSYGGPTLVIRRSSSSPACPSTAGSRSTSPGSGTWSTSSAACTCPSTTSTSCPRAPPTNPSTWSPDTSSCAATRRWTTCGTATTSRATSRACSASNVDPGAAAPVRPLERRLDEGHQAHQGDHRRDRVELRLAQEDPAPGGARLRGRHLQGDQAHLEGDTPMIDGVSFVIATEN